MWMNCGRPYEMVRVMQEGRYLSYNLTCCDVQHVSGLPSTRHFLPTDLSKVELTLHRSLRTSEVHIS